MAGGSCGTSGLIHTPFTGSPCPAPPTVDPNRKEAEMALFIIFTALVVAVFALAVTWGGLTNDRLR
jgi:hypothetical protein